MTSRLALALVAVAACGDAASHDSRHDAAVDEVDAMDEGECWPVMTAQPGGSITLGTDDGTFAALADDLSLAWGGQAGFGFYIAVRQTGFGTGDPVDTLNPTNPRTRVRAYFVENGILLNSGGPCPNRLAYRDVGGGELESIEPVPVPFDGCWRARNLVGKQIRIEGELLDWNGTTYATETHIVTALAPSGDYPDEPDPPGCPQ